MNRYFCLLLFVISGTADAAGVIDFLKIDKDVVVFSTTETKSTVSPACMTAENADYWTFSLASDSGRAAYSLIVTAMAKNLDLEVASAEDCADSDGYERADGVNLVFAQAGAASNQGGISVYKGDGVTKIGTLASVIDKDTWLYTTAEGTGELLELDNEVRLFGRVYFRSNGCSGSTYLTSNGAAGFSLAFEHLDNGKLYRVSNGGGSYTTKSYMKGDGQCYEDTRTNTFYPLHPYVHPVCGEYRCILKGSE